MPRDTAIPHTLTASIGQFSSSGRKPTNQDFHGAMVPQDRALRMKGVVLAIADGISTSPVSREAAETAVKSLLTDYYSTPETWTVKTSASRIIAATNAWLHDQNRRAHVAERDHGKICTLSALILKGRTAHIFHIGDCRISRLAKHGLEPLTEDHCVRLSSAEVYLGRAMGAEPHVEIDYQQTELARGDTFLLTTDGVHDHVDALSLARILRETPDLDLAARSIAQQALDGGGPDNVTVQVVRIDALPETDADGGVNDGAGLPVPPQPQAGAVIDGFRVVRQIHASNRSHVYLAIAPDGSQAALKIPSIDLREDPAYLRRFAMEEWIARRISNPHVLRPAATPESRSCLYVATEFVEGRSLRQWMRDNPSPTLESVRTTIEQIIVGLRAFHRQEMLHQDLRPENIIIDVDGTAKIIDFGSTFVAGVQEAAPRDSDNAILGTAQYTAPEYFTGDAVSWRSDLFSLGVIAYEMLTGRLPYGVQVSRVRNRADQSRLTYRPARDDEHPTPEWMDDALRKAVHPDPLRRFDALSEFAIALRTPDHRGRRHQPLIERNPLRFWQGVSVVLALLVLILLERTTG